MNKILKSMVLTLTSVVIGFIAIALPFNLLGTLTNDAVHIVFISELVIYFIVALVFLAVSDKKKQEKIKIEKRHEQRREKIERVQREWIDIAA